MDDATALLVIIAAAFIFFKWLTSTSPSPRSQLLLTQGMVDIVQAMFPHVDPLSIRYDLERTLSVEATTDKILSTGSLPTPPPTWTPPVTSSSSSSAAGGDNLYAPPPRTARVPTARMDTETRHNAPTPPQPDLITKYNLRSKLASPPSLSKDGPRGSAGKSWSTSKDERQTALRRRQEEMIIKARKALEEKIKKGDLGDE
ncbi:hypothetical protein SAICODRAFT_26666 [Saitoella complicata NRRL Y-17804]|uniref:Coupling of ubiquitin conjugation to ER degradation protein 1 n=1 Tax=Saitoella complicata (strain BCRC 22490 / CBS 7301 / JCM 7358 / NBRC 10748 / NRRL Y-17804) TaxID=698492 RepID=A0A0E9NBV8_SAICN|nr:uncharacterized protein SAICODRAFT_26666 [Saitoella complicata NRRL Y-17804]ODQ51577.1 hypothetical protein SAICODRAFT_26666 [Saitoella complicata NRRL Y-17804]GAO47329.1 hypothetical protein G7K_1537-t1 [Saitoella complicata NRRL Y-17804]